MNRKGFTLIEIIAAIALLGIISIISVVSVNKIVQDRKIENCKNLVYNIKMAAKEYVNDNRYNEEFNNDKKFFINFTANSLSDKNYLVGDIYDPFTEEKWSDDDIEIYVKLKDDYSVDKLDVLYVDKFYDCMGTVETEIDSNGPVMSLTVLNGQDYAKTNVATVTLEDIGIGLHEGEYTLKYDWSMEEKSCSDLTYEKSISINKGQYKFETNIDFGSYSGDGQFYVCNKENIVDIFNNKLDANTIKKADMYLDNEGPKIDLTNEVIHSNGTYVKYNGEWINKAVRSILKYEDFGFGVDNTSVKIKMGDGNYQSISCSSQMECIYEISADNRNENVIYQVCDNGGNCSDSDFILQQDIVTPSINILSKKIQGSNSTYYDKTWTNKDVEVTFEYIDNESGIAAINYYKRKGETGSGNVDGEKKCGYDPGKKHQCTDLWHTDGARKVIGYDEVCDKAGNCAQTGEYEIWQDKVAPSCNIVPDARGAYVQFGDSHSGTKCTNIDKNHKVDSCTSQSTCDSNGKCDCDVYSHDTIYAYVEDNVGNVRTCRIQTYGVCSLFNITN